MWSIRVIWIRSIGNWIEITSSPVLVTTNSFTTSWKVLLSTQTCLGPPSRSLGSSLDMADTYIWTC